MDRPRLFRRLRIVWTALFGTFCVLLILLWARSYYRFDWFGPGITLIPSPSGQELHPKSGFVFESAGGALAVWYVGNLRDSTWYAWHVGSSSPEPQLRVTGDDGESASDGFRAKTHPNGSIKGAAPHWCLAFLCAVLLTSVWVRHFSVRTMLIATTLIAVVQCLVMFASRKS